jgi:hypothetical protein
MFREICQFIKNQAGLADPYVQEGHRLASAPGRCALISEAAGGETFPDLPDEADVNIMVVTRAATYLTARADAWVIYTALHGAAGHELPIIDSGPSWLAMTIDAITTPQFIGIDEKGRFEFSCNYIFRMEQARCSSI